MYFSNDWQEHLTVAGRHEEHVLEALRFLESFTDFPDGYGAAQLRVSLYLNYLSTFSDKDMVHLVEYTSCNIDSSDSKLPNASKMFLNVLEK